MFQEFFTDTLISRFIKRLIRSTNLPLISIIDENSYIVSGHSYLFKNKVIYCKQSGYLTQKAGKPLANYIEQPYNPDDTSIHYNFHSKHMYYDPDTHYHLGQYLRLLKNNTGLDLMPYYNCFNYSMIEGVTLCDTTDDDSKNFKIGTDSTKKLYAIPVKFGKTYTIAIDSDVPIQLRALIYHKDLGLVLTGIGNAYYTENINCYYEYPSTSFDKPFIIRIPDVYNQNISINSSSEKALAAQEPNLYLAIQVAATNSSSIVVLEGDYTKSWNVASVMNIDNIQMRAADFIEDLSYLSQTTKNTLINFIMGLSTPVNLYNKVYEYGKKLGNLDSAFFSDLKALSSIKATDFNVDRSVFNISLLHFNTTRSFAFSDRLIEYLLESIVHSEDTLPGNFAYLGNLIGIPNTSGQWNGSARDYGLYTASMKAANSEYIVDQDGFLNSTLEAAFLKEHTK